MEIEVWPWLWKKGGNSLVPAATRYPALAPGWIWTSQHHGCSRQGNMFKRWHLYTTALESAWSFAVLTVYCNRIFLKINVLQFLSFKDLNGLLVAAWSDVDGFWCFFANDNEWVDDLIVWRPVHSDPIGETVKRRHTFTERTQTPDFVCKLFQDSAGTGLALHHGQATTNLAQHFRLPWQHKERKEEDNWYGWLQHLTLLLTLRPQREAWPASCCRPDSSLARGVAPWTWEKRQILSKNMFTIVFT